MEVERESSEGLILVEHLLQTCQGLLGELRAFSAYIEQAKHSGSSSQARNAVDLKQFKDLVSTELESLQRVSSSMHIHCFSMS